MSSSGASAASVRVGVVRPPPPRRTPRTRRRHAASPSCRIQCAACVACAPPAAHGRSPTSSSCQTTTVGVEVVDDEGELVRLLAPVRGAEHRADLAAREQQLLQRGRSSGRARRPGRRARPRRHAGRCAHRWTRAAASGQRQRARSPSARAIVAGQGADVGAEHVGERAAIGRHRKNLSGALRAPDSPAVPYCVPLHDRCASVSVRGPPGFSLTSCVATQ